MNDYKSKTSAFFWGGIGKIFGYDLKKEYDAEEEFAIEMIVRSIENGTNPTYYDYLKREIADNEYKLEIRNDWFDPISQFSHFSFLFLALIALTIVLNALVHVLNCEREQARNRPVREGACGTRRQCL
ncbi:MAG: DUF4294 domain-containing protein [Bacteroidetes bacterium]|nr:DUF4294 domain-containing protein [Bacteroidota bacterium]